MPSILCSQALLDFSESFLNWEQLPNKCSRALGSSAFRQTSNGQEDCIGGAAGADSDSSEAAVSAVAALENEADLIIDRGTIGEVAMIAAAEVLVLGDAKEAVVAALDEAVGELREGGGGCGVQRICRSSSCRR